MSKSADNPYPGSRAFQLSDRAHFHGRGADAAEIVRLWKTSRLTVVTGPVASGKTSLLLAGAYPLMLDERLDVLPVGRVSGGMAFPFAALPEHNPYTLALLRSWAPDDVSTGLAGLTVSDFVRKFASQHDRPVFAAIDQVEDLAVDPPWGRRRAWRRQFLAELAQACADHPRLHLLLSARCEAFSLISTEIGIGARHELGPLTFEEATEAIIRPARSAGRVFTEEAARDLIGKLGPSRMPAARGERLTYLRTIEPSLLQVACAQLWRDLPPAVQEITGPAVRAFSDVNEALVTYCATVITQVAAEHEIPSGNEDENPSETLRSWLLKTFVTSAGNLRPVAEGALVTGLMPNTVVRGLVDRHLLSCELRSAARWYQLLTPRLIEPLRRACVTRPSLLTAAGYMRGAERCLSLGDVDLAQRCAERALGSEPDLRTHADAESLLGNVAYEREMPVEALSHYREAASLLEAAGDRPAAASALAAAGQAFLALEMPPEAVAELQAADERVPNAPVLRIQLALALWQRGESRAAVAVLSDVLSIDGGNPEALRVRGEILADLGDADKAMRDLGRPFINERPSTRAARGLAHAKLGKLPEATKDITDAMKAAPRNGRVLLYAARASEVTGDKKHSRELAQDALDATDPPLSDRQRKLAQKLAGHV